MRRQVGDYRDHHHGCSSSSKASINSNDLRRVASLSMKTGSNHNGSSSTSGCNKREPFQANASTSITTSYMTHRSSSGSSPAIATVGSPLEPSDKPKKTFSSYLPPNSIYNKAGPGQKSSSLSSYTQLLNKSSKAPINSNDLRRVSTLSMKTGSNHNGSSTSSSTCNKGEPLQTNTSTLITTSYMTHRSSSGSSPALAMVNSAVGPSDKPKKTSSSYLLPNSIYNKAGPGQKSSSLSSYTQLLNKSEDSRLIDIRSQSINSDVQDPRLKKHPDRPGTTVLTTITNQEDFPVSTRLHSSLDDQINTDTVKVTSSELSKRNKVKNPITSLADSTTHKIDDQGSSEVSSSSDADLSRVLQTSNKITTISVSRKPVMNLPLPKFARVIAHASETTIVKKPTPDRELTTVSSSNKLILNKTPLISLSTTRNHMSPSSSASFSTTPQSTATPAPMVDYSKFNIRKKTPSSINGELERPTSVATSISAPSASLSSNEEKASPIGVDSETNPSVLDENEEQTSFEKTPIVKDVVVPEEKIAAKIEPGHRKSIELNKVISERKVPINNIKRRVSADESPLCRKATPPIEKIPERNFKPSTPDIKEKPSKARIESPERGVKVEKLETNHRSEKMKQERLVKSGKTQKQNERVSMISDCDEKSEDQITKPKKSEADEMKSDLNEKKSERSAQRRLESKKTRKKFELKLKERMQAKSKEKFKVAGKKKKTDEKPSTKLKGVTKRSLKGRMKTKASLKSREKSKQRKSSLFSFDDEAPIYLSMYDKVKSRKARSCANQSSASVANPSVTPTPKESSTKQQQTQKRRTKASTSKRRDSSNFDESDSPAVQSDDSSHNGESISMSPAKSTVSAKSTISSKSIVSTKSKPEVAPKRKPKKKNERRIVAKDFEIHSISTRVQFSPNTGSSSLSSSSSSSSNSSSSSSSSSSEDEDAELTAIVAEAAGRIGDEINVIEAANSPQLSPPPSPVDSSFLISSTDQKPSNMDELIAPSSDAWNNLVTQPLHINLPNVTSHTSASTPSLCKYGPSELILSSPSICDKSAVPTPECSPGSKQVPSMAPETSTLDSRCETEQAISTLLMEMDTDSTSEQLSHELSNELETRTSMSSQSTSPRISPPTPSLLGLISPSSSVIQAHNRPATPSHQRPATPLHQRPATPLHQRPATPSHHRVTTPSPQRTASPALHSPMSTPIRTTTATPPLAPILALASTSPPLESSTPPLAISAQPSMVENMEEPATEAIAQVISDTSIESMITDPESCKTTMKSDEPTPLLSVESSPQHQQHTAIEPEQPDISETANPIINDTQQAAQTKQVGDAEVGKHSLPDDVASADENRSDIKRIRRNRKKSLHVNPNTMSSLELSTQMRNCAAGQQQKLSPYDIFEFRDSDDDEATGKTQQDNQTVKSAENTDAPNSVQAPIVTCKPVTSPCHNNLLQTVANVQTVTSSPSISPKLPLNLAQPLELIQKTPPQPAISPNGSSNENKDPSMLLASEVSNDLLQTVQLKSDILKVVTESMAEIEGREELSESAEAAQRQREREYVTELNQDGKLSLTIRKASNQARETVVETRPPLKQPSTSVSNEDQTVIADEPEVSATPATALLVQPTSDSQVSTENKANSQAQNVKPTRRSARLMQSATKEKRPERQDPNLTVKKVTNQPREVVVETRPPLKQPSTSISSEDQIPVADEPEVSTTLITAPVTIPVIAPVTTPMAALVSDPVSGPVAAPPAQLTNEASQVSAEIKTDNQAQNIKQPTKPTQSVPKDKRIDRQDSNSTTERRPKRLTRLAAKTFGSNISEQPTTNENTAVPLATASANDENSSSMASVIVPPPPRPLMPAVETSQPITEINKPISFCVPSYLPPRKRLGWFWSQKQLLEQRYLVVWTSRFTLKDAFAAVQMHFISGNNKMPSWSYRAMLDETGMPLPIQINQRMRLDPDQLEGVQRKMAIEEDHCVLLAVPVGRDQSEYLKQSTSLKVGFIDYLTSKEAAGIVYVCQPGESQPSYIIHIFPSCTFVTDHILQREPDLLSVTQNIDNLIVVITTA